MKYMRIAYVLLVICFLLVIISVRGFVDIKKCAADLSRVVSDLTTVIYLDAFHHPLSFRPLPTIFIFLRTINFVLILDNHYPFHRFESRVGWSNFFPGTVLQEEDIVE